MSNTYTQIHIQTVFAVQSRACVIHSHWKQELYRYITGIVENHHHKVLAINGMPDHVHLLFGMRPSQSLSDLMQRVKGGSSKWINDRRLSRGKFSWQEGFGAFSYSRSQISSVIGYIQQQEEHHRHRSFMEEYREFLRKFDVVFDERYLFTPVEFDSDNE